MNAPLIVVQGDLLVPTLFPLAAMPYATYGEEWTLYGSRPALTEYEIPFYAARFITAYISAMDRRNDRFPYTPASLWGKFRRNDELTQTAQDNAAVTHDPVSVEPDVATPAPFAFETFSAPEKHPPPVTPPGDRRKQVAGGAIALACAAFIAWAMFGPKSGHRVEPESTQAVQPQLAANTAKPVDRAAASAASTANASTTTSTAASIAASNTVSAISPAASTTAAGRALPAAPKPAVIAEVPAAPNAAKPAVKLATKPASQPASSQPAQQPVVKPVAPPAPVERLASNQIAIAAPKVAKPRPAQNTTVRDVPVVKTKPRVVHHKREPHRYELVHRRHGYQGEPVYRSTEHAAPLAVPSRRTYGREDHRANGGTSSPSITDMYNMLAHSAVLDDNSGSSSRSGARPAPRGTAASGSGYGVELNQRRVTDDPSQFAK